jgi:hypothetical protein
MWQVDKRPRPKVQRNQCWKISRVGKEDFPGPPKSPQPAKAIAAEGEADELAGWPVGFKMTAGLFRRLRLELEYRGQRSELVEQKHWWRLLKPDNPSRDRFRWAQIRCEAAALLGKHRCHLLGILTDGRHSLVMSFGRKTAGLFKGDSYGVAWRIIR